MSQIGREEVSGVPGIEHEIHRFVEHKPRLNKINFQIKNKQFTPPRAEILCVKNVGAFEVSWVHNEMIKVMYAENMKKNRGSCFGVTC